MTHFKPACSHLDQLRNIDRAYRRAGMQPPSKAQPIHDLVTQQPDAHAVAAGLARDALTRPGTDPQAWLDDALDQMVRAVAADTLRHAFTGALQAVIEQQTPDMVAACAKAVAPAVNKTAKQLAKAAAELPKGDPFNIDAIIAADATKAMKAAHETLEALGDYASIHRSHGPRGDYQPALARLLPILDIDECHVEQQSRYNEIIVNRTALSPTFGVRNLDRDAQRNGDDWALVDVARGRYPGVRIGLARSIEEADDRCRNVAKAFTREIVRDPRTVMAR